MGLIAHTRREPALAGSSGQDCSRSEEAPGESSAELRSITERRADQRVTNCFGSYKLPS